MTGYDINRQKDFFMYVFNEFNKKLFWWFVERCHFPNLKEYLGIFVKDPDYKVRIAVAYSQCDNYLDILVNDADYRVRIAVADCGLYRHLDILVNDTDYRVRQAVANRRYDKYLDVLVHDSDERVRKEIAENGQDKYLDILVNDSDAGVRKLIAHKGRDKYMDKLVKDPDYQVRLEVARLTNNIQNLKELSCDKDGLVRFEVYDRLRRKCYYSMEEEDITIINEIKNKLKYDTEVLEYLALDF